MDKTTLRMVKDTRGTFYFISRTETNITMHMASKEKDKQHQENQGKT